MPQGSAQVSSGTIAPTVKGPERDTKEFTILAALILIVSGLLAAAWYYSQSSDQAIVNPATGAIGNANVPDLLKQAAVSNQAGIMTTHSAQGVPPVAAVSDIIHTDIYFEVGRKGLTDEGKAQLSSQADMLKRNEDYGVLIQGYTDQQGSASYNKQLGMKRAETVKAELVNAGIAEHRIKAVCLGEEGVLCIDTSDTCRHMNRRVHLEVRKVGQEHMAVPAVADTPAVETTQSAIESNQNTDDTGSSTDGLVPSTNASDGNGVAPLDETAGGS